MHLKLLSGKWQRLCIGFNVINSCKSIKYSLLCCANIGSFCLITCRLCGEMVMHDLGVGILGHLSFGFFSRHTDIRTTKTNNTVYIYIYQIAAYMTTSTWKSFPHHRSLRREYTGYLLTRLTNCSTVEFLGFFWVVNVYKIWNKRQICRLMSRHYEHVIWRQ